MQATTKEGKGAERSKAASGKQAGSTGDEVIQGKRFDDLDPDEYAFPHAEADYLRAAGWKQVEAHETPNPMKRWLDPQTGKPDRQVRVVPEVLDLSGRVQTPAVYQSVSAIPPWYYSRKDAVQIQQARDAAKAKGKQ